MSQRKIKQLTTVLSRSINPGTPRRYAVGHSPLNGPAQVGVTVKELLQRTDTLIEHGLYEDS